MNASLPTVIRDVATVARPMRGAKPFDWFLLVMFAANVVLAIVQGNTDSAIGWSIATFLMLWPRDLGRKSVWSVLLLTEAAAELRRQGCDRMVEHGATDERGAALWDAGCHIDPLDHDALGATR